jgi:hypothetical protein
VDGGDTKKIAKYQEPKMFALGINWKNPGDLFTRHEKLSPKFPRKP